MNPRFFITLVSLLLLQPVSAQQMAPGAGGGEAAALQQRIQTVAGELRETEEKVLADNPSLAEQRDDYQSLLNDTIEAEGADPAASIARLKEIRKEAEGASDMSDDRKQALAAEFRSTRRELLQARQTAMQDEDVTAAREAYQSKLLEAMEQANPDTPQLLAELQQLQSKLRERISGGQSGR